MWGGSVLDSVIGAFVTQAVSDVQSSTAFMNLAATWPSAHGRVVVVQGEGSSGGSSGGSCGGGGSGSSGASGSGGSDVVAAGASAGGVGQVAGSGCVGPDTPYYQRGAVGEWLIETTACADNAACCFSSTLLPESVSQRALCGICQSLYVLPMCCAGVGVDMVDWVAVMNAPPHQLEAALHGR